MDIQANHKGYSGLFQMKHDRTVLAAGFRLSSVNRFPQRITQYKYMKIPENCNRLCNFFLPFFHGGKTGANRSQPADKSEIMLTWNAG
jgi:hypothetical protein